MFRNLYTRLAIVLLGIFLAIGVLYALLTIYTTRLYFQEVNQKLNRILARQLVSEKVLLTNGTVNQEALQNVFHMLMVVNPGIEVYLLDRDGKILAFSAPPGKVKRQSVSLDPIKRLLSNASRLPILGDDPRDTASRKVFSVAPIMLDGHAQGSLYIILGGEEFDVEAQMLQGSYILKLSLWAALGGLLFALLAALLLFNRMTRPLRELSAAMESFRQSGFSDPHLLPDRDAGPSGNEIEGLTMIYKQMADRIALQIRELKASDAPRREFLANVAHDLRTPLTSLQGYIETLLMKEGTLTPEEKRTYLEIAIRRSDQLGKLVGNLFELAKLDSPDVPLRFELFSLPELIQDIVQKFQLAAEKKKVLLRADAADDLPLAFADIGLYERVFENLIDNALRYTPQNGSITIRAILAKDRIAVQVSDTGSGIPAEDLPHLFDRPYRRERARQNSTTGTGLGLAIVKRILELHGSAIAVNSTPNAGTSFAFTIPVPQTPS